MVEGMLTKTGFEGAIFSDFDAFFFGYISLVILLMVSLGELCYPETIMTVFRRFGI
jgi:hypothetical protein